MRELDIRSFLLGIGALAVILAAFAAAFSMGCRVLTGERTPTPVPTATRTPEPPATPVPSTATPTPRPQAVVPRLTQPVPTSSRPTATATPFIVYLTEEQLAYACTGEYVPGREPGGYYHRIGLPPLRCSNPIPPGARIVIVPSGPSRLPSSSELEAVSIVNAVDYDHVLIRRRNGELWLLQYGVGCLSLSIALPGKTVYIYSPGLFAGIGSKILIPDRSQDCRIWNSQRL